MATQVETYFSFEAAHRLYDTETYSEPEYSTRYYTEEVQEPVYRSEPVYDTKYYYDIERWVYDRTDTASGSYDINTYSKVIKKCGSNENIPYWPEQNLLSNERNGTQTEVYTVTCHNVNDKNNSSKTYDIPFSLWKKVEPNMVMDVVIYLGKITEISEKQQNSK